MVVASAKRRPTDDSVSRWLALEYTLLPNDELAHATGRAMECRRARRHRSRGAFPGKPVEPANQHDDREQWKLWKRGRRCNHLVLGSRVARGPSRSMCTHRGLGTVVSHSVRATPRRPLISLNASRLRSNSRWQRTFHEGQSGAFGRCDFSSTSPTQDPAASTIGIIRCACRRCMIRCSPHFQRGWCAVQDAPSDRASRVS